jgi:hypothetical protein
MEVYLPLADWRHGSQPLSYSRLLAALYVGDFSLTSNSIFLGGRSRPSAWHGAWSREQQEDLLRKARLQLYQFAREFLVRTYRPPQLNESPHDRNVYLDGSLTMENRRENGHSLFREGVEPF